MSREQLQRLALVTIVVLLAALASERIMTMIRPSCHAERFVHVRVHEAVPPVPPVPPLPPSVEAHEMAAHARHLGEEARRMAEAHRRMAEEHRRLLAERRTLERRIEREVESTLEVR